ncbi:cholesterol esterase, partial [Spiromyces aspiralis]
MPRPAAATRGHNTVGWRPHQQSAVSSTRQPVVLLWHGFMMNSEVWVSHPTWNNILPFRLAEAGFDVWLGNSRGNKYSYKHSRFKPYQREFWDYSIDDIALIDVPACVQFILDMTKAKRLTYIGFSQGTAQMFAALSRNPKLDSQVEHFIALAPAFTPKVLSAHDDDDDDDDNGFHNSVVDYFIKASPSAIYLILGRKCALPITLFWMHALPRRLFVALLDLCLRFLFGWNGHNTSAETKATVYWHLYSFTSVKCIVHWMQIIRTQRLRMYDDRTSVFPITSASQRPLGHHIPIYPLNRISTKITMFHGARDTLSSIDILLNQLARRPNACVAVPEYEHLDFIWSDDVGDKVYTPLLRLLGVNLCQSSATLPYVSQELGGLRAFGIQDARDHLRRALYRHGGRVSNQAATDEPVVASVGEAVAGDSSGDTGSTRNAPQCLTIDTTRMHRESNIGLLLPS